MVALDRSLDDGVNLRGRPSKADYQVGSLHSAIYWENPQAYSSAGSPPNGADYVALRDGGGAFLKAAQVKSLEFKGAKTHALLPVTWQVDPSPPAHTRESCAPIGRSRQPQPDDPSRRCGACGARGAHVRDPLWARGAMGLRIRAGLDQQRAEDDQSLEARTRQSATIRVPTPISWRSCRASPATRTGTRRPSISPPTRARTFCSHCAT